MGWPRLPARRRTSIAKLNAEANRALKIAASSSRSSTSSGYEPIGDTPEQASARIKSDVVRWTKIIRDAGIQPQ